MSVRDAFLEQARFCARLQSSFTQQLCEVLAAGLTTETPIERAILEWPDDPAPFADNVPLRITGALHAIARAGRATYLNALYPPAPLPAAGLLLAAVRRALIEHEPLVLSYLSSPPQTNEVGRSAPLLAGLLVISERTALPVSLFEIGASAGLNLLPDKYRYRFDGATWGSPDAAPLLQPIWTGSAPPVAVPLTIRSRRGCDLQPVLLSVAGQRERLLSYVWPEQPERLFRLNAAIETARTCPVTIDPAEAATWLEGQLPVEAAAGTTRVLFHSIVWNYLGESTRSRLNRHIAAVGAAATRTAPFAWLRFEAGAADIELRLTLWPDGDEQLLATSHPHGAWVRWLG